MGAYRNPDAFMNPVTHLIEQLPRTAERTAAVPKDKLTAALKSLGMNPSAVVVEPGLRVSSAHFKLPAGARVRDLRALTEDLALRLEVPSIRVATNRIPGLVTLEITHELTEDARVSLGDVLTPATAADKALPWAVGLHVDGTPAVFDLAEAPHVLIGGQTGSGKSSHLHTIVLSLAVSRSPEQVQLVLVDPKRVDLAPFWDLPHVTKLVTTTDEMAALLDDLHNECEFRYEEFASAKVADIEGYNRWAGERDNEAPMPRIVVVLDELGMLMAGPNGGELAVSLTLLAQTSRAAGIHLVLSTQRPSAATMPTQLRSQLTTRVACRMATATDSRMILDSTGAEKLFGQGDTLLRWGGADGVRLQGTYITPTWREWLITESIWAWQESNHTEETPSQNVPGQG